jgi:membrane protease YdiL (CAAX protease family)
MQNKILSLMTLILLGAVPSAFAYVGPGAGLSLLGALWGLLLAIGAAVLFLILWPLRRLRQRARVRDDEADARHNIPRR